MHPAIARAQTILAAPGARHHSPDLPEMPAGYAGLRVELDGPIRIHHGPSVGQNPGHGNRVERADAEERCNLREGIARAREDQLVPAPDPLARGALPLVD